MTETTIFSSNAVKTLDDFGRYQLDEVVDPTILEMVGGGDNTANYVCPSGNVYCPSQPPTPPKDPSLVDPADGDY